MSILDPDPLVSPPCAPSQTGVIDAGVELFAVMFPRQKVEGQVQSLATLSSYVRSSKLERNPGRRQAIIANTMTALGLSLANAESGGSKDGRVMGTAQVHDMMKTLLQVSSLCTTRRSELNSIRKQSSTPVLVSARLQPTTWVC